MKWDDYEAKNRVGRHVQLAQQEYTCIRAILSARESHNDGDSRLWFAFEAEAETSDDHPPDICLRYISRYGCMPANARR